MSEVSRYLDCGCAILKDGSRSWCPSCSQEPRTQPKQAGNPIHLEVPEPVYSSIMERALATKRDIDMAAGPNPIDPRIARAKENIRLVVEGLQQIEIVPM